MASAHVMQSDLIAPVRGPRVRVSATPTFGSMKDTRLRLGAR